MSQQPPTVSTKAPLRGGLLRRVIAAGRRSGTAMRRLWRWYDDRSGTSQALDSALHHPVPRNTGWMYVFGSMTLTAFILQVITGIALALMYIPSPANAYDTIGFITNQAVFGRILRGMHYFGASAMVLFIGIHAIRVFLTGSYKFPREVSWLSGVLLLLITLGMAFTGQILRWDQNAVWSLVVAAQQAGRTPLIGRHLAHFILAGDTFGAITLSRLFAVHVFFIPALIFAALALHLYLVIHNGISRSPGRSYIVDPKTEREAYHEYLKRDGVPFWPDAAWRDAVASLLLVGGIILLAALAGPPSIGSRPDPTNVIASPRPDWYFLWYFAVLALLPHASENYVIILAPALFVLAMVLLPLLFRGGERSPLRRPWAMGIVMCVVLIIAVFWVEGVRAPWSPDFTAQPLSPEQINSTNPQVVHGARLAYDKGCLYCHHIDGTGGRRGPELTRIGDSLTRNEMTIRILNGGYNMPAYANNLKAEELDNIVDFLQSRRREPSPAVRRYRSPP